MATDRTNHTPNRAKVDFISPANEDAFAQAPLPVRLLTLEVGAVRVFRDNEAIKKDELWHGDARDPLDQDGTSIPVYLRIATPVPLVAELLCGVIARMLGLPAPEAFVLVVEPGQLKDSKLASKTERKLYVGTRDIGGSTFSQLLREDSETAQAMIKAWKHLVPVTALDEWLANPDRNLGNILYVAQALHIIDHAEAFGGAHRQSFSLSEITRDEFTNKLALLLDCTHATKRQQILNQAREWITFTAGGLDIGAAVASADITRWQSAKDEAELVHFITTRLSITHSLLCNRLGHPQLDLST